MYKIYEFMFKLPVVSGDYQDWLYCSLKDCHVLFHDMLDLEANKSVPVVHGLLPLFEFHGGLSIFYFILRCSITSKDK